MSGSCTSTITTSGSCSLAAGRRSRPSRPRRRRRSRPPRAADRAAPRKAVLSSMTRMRRRMHRSCLRRPPGAVWLASTLFAAPPPGEIRGVRVSRMSRRASEPSCRGAGRAASSGHARRVGSHAGGGVPDASPRRPGGCSRRGRRPRFASSRTAASSSAPGTTAKAPGSRSEPVVPYSEPGSPVNRASHEGGRIDDYTDVPGEAARLTRLAGYLSSVVAPITAGGRLWGALFVFSAQPNYFPPNAEQRLADFTQLVALALESAEAHDQLTASRARIVEASVAERRRLERNLHDGAQQRLVTLALHLRMAQECLREDPAAAEALLESVGEDLKLRARGAPGARSRPPPGDPHRPRARARPAVARQPCPVPGRDRRRNRRPVCPRQSKRPSTTSSPKASRTRRSTPAPPRPSSCSRRRPTPSSSRSETTAAAART